MVFEGLYSGKCTAAAGLAGVAHSAVWAAALGGPAGVAAGAAAGLFWFGISEFGCGKMNETKTIRSERRGWDTLKTLTVLAGVMTGIVFAYFCWQLIDGAPENSPGNDNSRIHLSLWAGALSGLVMYPILVRRGFQRLLVAFMVVLNVGLTIALVYMLTAALWNG